MSKKNPTQKEIAILEIEEAATKLPEVLRPIMKERTMLGHDLLLLNKKTVGGQPIDPGTMYVVKIPEYHKVNHKDEMIKIYTSVTSESGHDAGYIAVCDYIKKVRGLNQPKNNGNKKTKAAA